MRDLITLSSSMAQQAGSAVSAIGKAVDLTGDGGVMREMLQEGEGKGLATGDIAMVRFTGTVEETGQVKHAPLPDSGTPEASVFNLGYIPTVLSRR